MSKAGERIDKNQRSIFELLRDLIEQPTSEGQLKIIDGLRAALRTAIKESPLSRHQIAGEMSHLLGETITKEMIDSWTREDQEIPPDPPFSKGGKIVRHIPAEYLPAFCRVTKDSRPLVLMGEAAGFFVLPGPEALRAEIHALNDEMARIRARKKRRETFLRELLRRDRTK